MNHLNTKGIVLARLNFGEADRIITIITPDFGKIRVIAKGVRKIKSKLAGGIELFSESDITFIQGRGEIGTLVSSRLLKNYGHIVQDLQRSKLGYEFLKIINRATEDAVGEEYYELLKKALEALDNTELATELTGLWFNMQLLKESGHSPNLITDGNGNKLDVNQKYSFDLNTMVFTTTQTGSFGAPQIKLLRLGMNTASPEKLLQVQGSEKHLFETLQLAKAMLGRVVRI